MCLKATAPCDGRPGAACASMPSMAAMDEVLEACRAAAGRPGAVIALTGAGVSAESGIPTFRGREGYWTVGAREYHPQELATLSAFERMPWEVWAWYLYRRTVCRRAAPNAGHAALVRLDAAIPDRFALVTQNVDGLHHRAGSPDARTFPIHGDIQRMRCAADCMAERWAIPDGVPDIEKGQPVAAEIRALLACPRCGEMARPHVLWFDESYDEPRYFLETVRGSRGVRPWWSRPARRPRPACRGRSCSSRRAPARPWWTSTWRTIRSARSRRGRAARSEVRPRPH